MDNILHPCGHRAAADEPMTCLVDDRFGEEHRVPQVAGRHCTCHGYPLTKLEARPKDRTDQ